jgi:hypothetical protein
MKNYHKNGEAYHNKKENRDKISKAHLKRKKRLGYINSLATRKKMSLSKLNENNPNYKDGRYLKSKNCLHRWIEKEKGKAKNYKCVDCDKQARDWSNINHKYRKVLEDYKPRCRSCHFQWGVKFNNTKFNK